MKYTEIKELATAELAERLAEEKANYMSMKLTHVFIVSYISSSDLLLM